MPGIASILSIASQAMWSSQTGIEVVSNNISNMNTAGYSKQTLNLNSRSPVSINGLIIGRGVDVTDISMAQDRFLDFQMFNSKMALGYSESRAYGLSSLEEIFNESDTDGLSQAMTDFFSAIQDMATTPEDQAGRVSLVGQAEILINQFHTMHDRIRNVQDTQNKNVASDVDSINLLAQQINEINREIANMESSGHTASDLRSTRTELMNELSELVDYSYFEGKDGQINIVIGGSRPLVESGNVNKLVTIGNADGNWDVYVEDVNGNRANITSKIEGGSLGGSLEVRDVECKELLDDINEIAYQMSTAFNAIHFAGYGLNGSTGINFFNPLADSTNAAKLIDLSVDIKNDVENVAASLNGEPGDNANALLLAELEESLLYNGGAKDFQDFYGGVITRIGSESQSAEREYNTQESVNEQIVGLRDSLVGVSIEEEMADLMKYQYVFQASARLYNIVDEMAEIVANLK